MTKEQAPLWRPYLVQIAGTENRQEIATAMTEADTTGDGVDRTTISRWFNAKTRPTDAGRVALFALAYGRSPLEAFVAAGLLDLADAERGLPPESLALLTELSGPGSRRFDA